MKPHIKKLTAGVWLCQGKYANGIGATPETSFAQWHRIEVVGYWLRPEIISQQNALRQFRR